MAYAGLRKILREGGLRARGPGPGLIRRPGCLPQLRKRRNYVFREVDSVQSLVFLWLEGLCFCLKQGFAPLLSGLALANLKLIAEKGLPYVSSSSTSSKNIPMRAAYALASRLFRLQSPQLLHPSRRTSCTHLRLEGDLLYKNGAGFPTVMKSIFRSLSIGIYVSDMCVGARFLNVSIAFSVKT